MKKFKVGDTVRRTGGDSRVIYDRQVKEAGVYVVSSVSRTGNWVGVKEVPDPADDEPFCAQQFELVTPVMTMAQEFAIAAGIQAHSVGDLYPVAVVGYQANADSQVVYFLENLQEGTVAMGSFGAPCYMHSADDALALAQGTDFEWKQGRPQFVDNAWRLYNPSNPVRVVRLQNMLHHDTKPSGS